MAYSLKKLGFTDVTILERTNRIGRKAEHFQYRGTKHPLSVVFWTNDYRHTLVPLLEEFGLLKDGSKGGDGRTSFWLTNDRSVPLLETTEYIASWIMNYLNVSDPNQAILRMIGDADKYTNIRTHAHIWFIGGGLTFESVNNVMGYNQLLLSKMRPVLKTCYYYNPYNPFYYGRK